MTHALHLVGPDELDGRPRGVDVVHVITTLTMGGAERQLEMVTRRSRHHSTVVALYEAGPIAQTMRDAGQRVEVLHATGWRKPLAPFVLARRLRRSRPQVVHVHLLSGQLLGIPAARLARVPVVVSTEHSLMDETIEGRRRSWWLRLLYLGLERMTTHTVAVSETTAERLKRWGVRAERVSVQGLGIDFEALAFDPNARAAVRQDLAIAPETSVIVAVGRLAPVKRMDVLLRAAAPLLREGAVLVVAGTGPLLADLRAVAAELGVVDQVRWLGPRAQIGPVLSAADVLVSASADETFGMAVVEALGSGLAVVYVECPALDELAERPAQAFQVPTSGDDSRDAALLGEAMALALAERDEQRWTVPSSLTGRYGAQAAADRLDAVYDRLLRNDRP